MPGPPGNASQCTAQMEAEPGELKLPAGPLLPGLQQQALPSQLCWLLPGLVLVEEQHLLPDAARRSLHETKAVLPLVETEGGTYADLIGIRMHVLGFFFLNKHVLQLCNEICRRVILTNKLLKEGGGTQ